MIEDRSQDMSELNKNELTNQNLQQEILREFVMNLRMDQKIRAGEDEIIHGEVSDGSKNITRKIEIIHAELVDGSKIGAREHERIHGEVLDESEGETR